MTPSDADRYPGPGARDYVLLAIGVAFVACGLFLLPRKPDTAIPCLAFSGACTVFAVGNVVRKRRAARLRPLSVEIVGGTPIRPLKSRVAGLSALLLGLGSILLAYWRSGPVLVLVCLVVMIVVGLLLAAGLATGRLPVGFLMFDPEGLTIGQRRDTFMVPWDAIGGLAPGELHDNPVLLLRVADLASIRVDPPDARARVVARLSSNVAWIGAHVMVMTSHYGIELPLLVSAIERYVADPGQRRQLAVPRLPEGS